MAPSAELSYLDRIVMEIIETERMYVLDLHSIVEGYLVHIIETADLPIIPEQTCALFGNIEDIYEFNSELLQELDLCKNDPVAIARCFVLKSDYFEIYTQYCTNYPNSVAALTECMRNKTLLKFFMERQEALKHPLPLGSYLLKPVQRILKYHLLLQEIAKHFDPDEDGYDVVEEAINTMTEVAWYINTMKRKHEHAVRLQEVQSLLINWRGPDLTTYGELVLEGTFRFHHTKNNRTLLLFERVLLITKRRGENFIYKTHITCSTLMLMEGAKDSLCFSVTHYKHPKQPHTVQARTMEEKKLWTHHIKRLIIENHHTIIPQKAKEVILEMDPMYQKCRFNAERKKKTQSEDFTNTRQSELTKQMLKNNKAMLKHSVSEGELRENRIALGSTSDESQALSVEDTQLCCTNREDATHCELQDEEKGSKSDDVMPEDFSNCMISWWSFRAKSLQLTVDQEWQGHGDSRLSPEERQASPNKLQFQNNTAVCGSAEGFKSMSDHEQTQIRHSVYHVRNVDGADRDAVKDELVLNQDAQSSEEEEEENCAGSENHSILPSSVLDKASAIAEHFIANAHRSSAAPDELRSQQIQQEVASSKTASASFNLLSPKEERVSGSGQHVCRRRDSILSKQERQLIDKIRNYYENAEQQDAGFSLKRRESLTYIPSGVVRTSVSHFSKIPRTDRRIKPLNTETSLMTSSSTSSDINTKPDQLTDLFSTEVDGSESHKSEEFSKELFRSSADMIKVWQEMEKEAISSLRENKFRDMPRFKGTSSASQSFNRKTENKLGEQELMSADCLATITEESPVKGKEAENKKESTENVSSLTKFKQNLQSRETFNQPRRWGSETSVNTVNKTNTPSLTEEERKKTLKGKPNLALSLTACVQTTQDVQQTHTSSHSSVTKIPIPFEGFSWPDVSELRSKYTSLERAPLSPLTSPANTPSPGCSTDSKASRVQRAGSLDQKLVGFGWTNLQNKTVNSDYFISAQAALPNNRTVAVLEKVKTHTHSSQSQNYNQTQSPISQEKMSLVSVTERCRLYEDLEEAVLRTEPETRNKNNKSDEQSSATQQGVVKNIREKFLNLE